MRYTALLLAAAAFVFTATPVFADSVNYRDTASGLRSARTTAGAQLGAWDPAAGATLDTGYKDTSGCSAGCLAAYVEVETATTTSGVCTVWGLANGDNGSTTDDYVAQIGTFSVAASSGSWAGSVCPGVGTGFGFSAPLPKHVKLRCANVAGVNLRGFMQCH